MYTFDADKITSYELGSDEPTTLAVQNVNLFTASADAILSRLGKVFIFIYGVRRLMVVGVVVCIAV
jgi:hypothetical protein